MQMLGFHIERSEQSNAGVLLFQTNFQVLHQKITVSSKVLPTELWCVVAENIQRGRKAGGQFLVQSEEKTVCWFYALVLCWSQHTYRLDDLTEN